MRRKSSCSKYRFYENPLDMGIKDVNSGVGIYEIHWDGEVSKSFTRWADVMDFPESSIFLVECGEGPTIGRVIMDQRSLSDLYSLKNRGG